MRDNVQKLLTLLQYCGAAIGVLYIGSFLYVALISITFPYPLEWMEGHTVDIIRRLINGQAFYVEPTLEYVPYLYTPLYFYASAFVALFTGTDYLAPRLISLLSILGCGIILYQWIRKEEGTRAIGLITAGLFFATYPLSARWFDVGRVDSLYLFLLAASVYVLYFYQTLRGTVLASILAVLAFFTKQSALLTLLPPMLAMTLFINRKHGLYVMAATISSIGLLVALYTLISDGWFYFYTFEIPAAHRIDTRKFLPFWTQDMLEFCSMMLLLASFTLYASWVYQGRRKALWLLALAAGFIGTAYVSRLHSFGWINVLMPAHYILALLSGLALCYTYPDRKRLFITCSVLLLIQFHALQYNPNGYAPTEESRAHNDKLYEAISSIEGDILFSEMQNMPVQSPYQAYYYGMAGFDIKRSGFTDEDNINIRKIFMSTLADNIARQRYAAIVTGNFLRLPDLNRYYQLVDQYGKPKEYVTGATGGRVSIYVPKTY